MAAEGVDEALEAVSRLSAVEQRLFLHRLMIQLSFETLSQLHEEIGHLLQRDFLSLLPPELCLRILSYLGARELCRVETVCKSWRRLTHAHDAELWGRLCANSGWDPQYHVLPPGGGRPEKSFYAYKYRVERNWALGQYRARAITGHSRAVFSVQLEGGRLYSSSFDNTVRVWDIATGELLQVFEGHTGGVSCVRMQNGVLVSGSSDTTLVCNVPSGVRMCIGYTGQRVWDDSTGECVRLLAGHTHEVTSLYHDGDTLVSGSCDGTVRIWKISTGECTAVLEAHDDYVISVQFDDQIIASASFDKTVKIWDRATRLLRMTLVGHTSGVKCVRFDARVIATASHDRTVRVWSRADGSEIAVLRGHTDEVWTVQLLYTGWGNSARLHKLVSGGRDGVRVWSVPEYTCQLHIPVEKGVTCVDMDPCTVVVSSFDKSIRVYDFDHRDDVVL